MSNIPSNLNGNGRKWKRYPVYKELGLFTGVQIPSHWSIMRLKHIAAVRPSNVDKKTVEGQKSVRLCNYVDVYKNEYITEGFDFMQASATNTQIAAFTLKAGDVIVTKDSETWMDIAVPAYVTADLPGVLCGYHLALLRPKTERIVGEYLFRSFAAPGVLDQLRVAANGITRFGLGTSAIADSVFPLPPVEEQQKITTFLKRETAKIDALIANKERVIELLQEKRTALICHAVAKGIDPSIPMKDSEVGWLDSIPESWNLVRNKVLFREIDNRSVNGDEELLTVSHITGVTRRSEKPDVTMFLAETLEGYKKCEAGDIVVNTMWAFMGALGTAFISGVVSPSYNVYRLRDERRLDPRYLDLLYRTPLYKAQIFRYSKGIWHSRLRLYPEAFFEIKTIVPSLCEQRRIVEYIGRIADEEDWKLSLLHDSIEKLREYRTALISAAVTGKIDVREEVY